jgi:tetratricopeptide (TPR) repeat protein
MLLQVIKIDRTAMLSGLEGLFSMHGRCLRVITILALLGNFSVAEAYSYLADQVQKEFRKDLYPIETILPGYERPRRDASKFAVAEFRVADQDLHIWSQAVAEVLRYRIQYVPGSRLYMPAPYNIHVDAGMSTEEDRLLLTSMTAFKNLRRSLGIDTVLTGEVVKKGDVFVLDVELIETRSEKITSKQQWTFAEDQLPGVLVEISKWVYQSLKVKLSAAELAYLEDRKTLQNDALQAFIGNYRAITRLEGALRSEKVNQLHQDHPDFTLIAVYAMHTRPPAMDLDQAYANLEYTTAIRDRFPGNSGVELESYRAMEIRGLPKHEVSKRLEGMKQLLVRNPQDSTIAIVFADALIKNGDTFKGLSVLLETVDRWPEQYRAWWSLGWGLNSHAWQVRGDSIWRDVPERAKQQYTRLSELSVEAVDQALTLNPYSPGLWSMKIDSLGSRDGYSKELIKTFDEAVKLAPKHRYIYENALHFSAGKWGGNATARKYIIDIAENNNPDALWVEAMKRKHVVDLDNWHERLGTSAVEIFIKEILDHPDGKYLALIVVVVIVVFVFQLGRRSA